MAFLCSQPVALAFHSNNAYNPNSCCLYKKRVYYNAEVTANVISSNGVGVQLSQAGVAKIQAAYNGTPLRVEVRVQPKCCAQCEFFCVLCGGCCKGDCVPVLSQPIWVSEIYFGRQDAEAKCPGIVSLCCFHAVLGCACLFENKVALGPEDVSVPILQGSGPQSVVMQQ